MKTPEVDPTCPHCKARKHPLKNLAVWNKRDNPYRCASCFGVGTFDGFYGATIGGPMPTKDKFFASVVKLAESAPKSAPKAGKAPRKVKS